MSKNQNYIKKLFLNYSFVPLILLTVIFLTVLLFLYREQYQEYVDVRTQFASNVEDQLDSSLQEMDRIANGLLFNKSFMQIMKDTDYSAKYIDYDSQVKEIFVSLDAPLFSTYRIIAFNQNAYYTLTQAGESSDYIKAAKNSYPWEEALLSGNGKKLIIPPHTDTFDSSGRMVYSVARPVTDGRYNFGFIEIQNLYENIRSICTLNEASGSVVLFSPEGEVLFPDDADEKQAEVFSGIFDEIQNSPGDSGAIQVGRQLVSYTTSSYSEWITAVYAPKSPFAHYAANLIFLVLGIYILMMISSLIMIRIIAKRMAAPLMELNRAVSAVTLDNMTFEPHVSSNITEINNINQSFRLMLEHLQEAIAKSVQARANEERANFLALQAQMNPHTLYNTLSMIESVSYLNGDREVSALCISFSQMLRYISDYTKRAYTMQDELNHLEQYKILTEKRYEGKLHIRVEAAEPLLKEILPKFTIQPLVENAVKHNFTAATRKLNILVSLTQEKNGWCLSVSDNGMGFSDEAIREITSQFQESDRCLKEHRDVVNDKIGKLGLNNIYIRCRILYGGRFRMEVFNQPDGGGCIRITVAMEEKNNEPCIPGGR